MKIYEGTFNRNCHLHFLLVVLHPLLKVLQSDRLELCDLPLEVVSVPVRLVVVALEVGVLERHPAGDASVLSWFFHLGTVISLSLS